MSLILSQANTCQETIDNNLHNYQLLKKYKTEEKVRNAQKRFYIAKKIFKKMSNNDIEHEIVTLPDKAIAIKLYRMETEVQGRPLRPLCELLQLDNANIKKIEESINFDELKTYIGNRMFDGMSDEYICSEIRFLQAQNEDFGLQELASAYGRTIDFF